MPPTRRPEHARLVGDRAGEAAAAMAEQLAVGQLARGAGAVVGQEHAAAPRRAGVDRPRHEVLAGAALAGDQDGEVVALHPLNLIGDALHRRAGADEARQQRLERPLERRRRRASTGRSRAAQRSKPCRSTAHSVRNRCRARAGERPRRSRRRRTAARPRRGRAARRAGRRAGRRIDRAPRPPAPARGRLERRSRRSPRTLHLPGAGCDEDHGRLRVARFEQRRRALARQQRRHHRGIDDPPDERVLAVHLDADVAAGRRRRGSLRAPAGPRPGRAPRRAPRRSRRASVR